MSSSLLRYAAKATAPSLIMTWVHFASLVGVRKFGFRVNTILLLCSHSLRMNGPLPTKVAGSVHLSAPFVTMSSRTGTPTQRAAIELKYGAGSVKVNEMSFPLTLML